MILKAYYLDKEVILGVPDDSLVYDGRGFVSPKQAKYVVLVHDTEVSALFPLDYPVQKKVVPPVDPCAPPLPPGPSVSWKNHFVCKVIGYDESESLEEVDVVAVVTPEGYCLCGLTSQGTEIIGVEVYTTTGE